jgi:heme/copper-type cytochrome/quinol oxidase subunit 2
MGIAVSILLIAVGAVLTWGVTAEAEGLDVNAIGVILMIVGILGLVVSMIFWSSWGGFRRRAAYVEGAPVAPAAAPRRRATVVEEEEAAPGPPGPPLP